MTVAEAPLIVVDDDPTGAQDQAAVPLLLSWQSGSIEAALSGHPHAVHLLTNSRALHPEEAYEIVLDAARAADAAIAEPRLVLRGDSTLRAHLLPEYEALRDALSPGTTPPLLLVPALPGAGRVTVDGRQWLIRGGRRVPLEETEFASDGAFAYASSRLVDWAAERSSGFFPAAQGIEVPLAEVRGKGGAERVRAALLEAAERAEPCVVAPDAETLADLETIAVGLRRAWLEAPEIVVRCAPAFASVLSGAGAEGLVALPAVELGLLVVVGSHVPMTTAQLAALRTAHPRSYVEVDAQSLAGPGAAQATGAAIEEARALLRADGLAVVATSRGVPPEISDPGAGGRVAGGLAAIVDRLRDDHDVLLSKGGITSAVNVRDGLHAPRARVVGPVAHGVSLWLAETDRGDTRPVIVFPGNVGGDDGLATLVDRLLEK